MSKQRSLFSDLPELETGQPPAPSCEHAARVRATEERQHRVAQALVQLARDG